MKSFRKFMLLSFIFIIAVFVYANLSFADSDISDSNREYLVDVNRITLCIEENGFENLDISEYRHIKSVEKYSGDEDFYNPDSDYVIREINGGIYRFDYIKNINSAGNTKLKINLILLIFSVFLIGMTIFVYISIILPFEKLKNVPYELAKGNLTSPIQESRSRFFGKFAWGINMLRENIEQQKQHELEMQKDKKTLLLSLSHDIKTPLSAIKMYAKALSKGIYTDKEKQKEAAESISRKADEIESFVTQIIEASRDDFLNFDFEVSEHYLSELVKSIDGYYSEKLAFVHTDFSIGKYSDCLVKGNLDRSIEVVQNIMENAVKYGNGKKISISFSEEDGCILLSVSNSGCTLSDTELPHIFESFWRGSNAENAVGSGLGLYICRQIMNKTGGEVFAEIKNDTMTVTVVFVKF